MGASSSGSIQEREPGQEQETQHDVQQKWKQKLQTEEGSRELRVGVEAKASLCPVCKGRHVYQRKLAWGYLQWLSDRLQE